MSILILGAGGHGKVIADILLRSGEQVGGFLDDDPKLWGKSHHNLPVLGAIESYVDYQPRGLILGIGSNIARKSIIAKLGDVPADLWINAVHPATILAYTVRLGHGSVICAGAVIGPDTVLGDHVIVNTSATIDHDCQIKDYAHIAPGSHLAGNIRVGEGALVGIGVAVIPHITIGSWSTIGAGATVARNVPDGVTAKGIPARWV